MARIHRLKLQLPYEIADAKGEVNWYFVSTPAEVIYLKKRIQNIIPKDIEKEITYPDWLIIEKYPDDTLRFVGVASELKNVFQRLVSKLETKQWEFEKEAIMMKTFNMHLLPIQYARIEDGSKNVEIRLWDAKRKDLRKGNIIIFHPNNDPDKSIKTRVIDLLWYSSMTEAYENYNAPQTGFDEGWSVEKRVDYMHRFYSPEKEKSNGVLAILFKKI
jgi:ASC-1-like (ASCH) protein